MKCLITGINGFAASHLAEHLHDLGHEVVGTVRIRSKFDPFFIHDSFSKFHMDLSDPFGVSRVIQKIKPDAVFHLAAQSFVGWSWDFPRETMQTNLMGTMNILEAVLAHCPHARVHIASSSQVYGQVNRDQQPMGKKTLFNPMNPYDTSKLAQEMLSLQYFNSYGLDIIRTRAFNISGPRRGECFAESSWAKQIAMIEEGIEAPVIRHGNLESERDYIDVRDVVKCYANALINGTPGKLYVIGSGTPRKMQEVLDRLVGMSKKKHEITLNIDPDRVRPSDTPTMAADTSDMSFLVNGQTHTFEQTLTDLLDYWRDRCSIECH